jgi:flagellar protein FlaF
MPQPFGGITMSSFATAAAQSSANSTENRALEREILTRVTNALESAANSNNNDALAKAASDNQLLWSVFVRDLQSDQNHLPQELRKQLIEIGQTVIREISENINKSLDVEFLVSINRAIIDGLSDNR